MNYKTIRIEEHEVDNQRKAVMFHLQEHGNLTSWEAIKHYGITRLAKYINELRNEGYNIITENQTVQTRFKNKSGEHRTTTIAVYHYKKPGDLGYQTRMFSDGNNCPCN